MESPLDCTTAEGLLATLSISLYLCSGAVVPVDKDYFIFSAGGNLGLTGAMFIGLGAIVGATLGTFVGATLGAT